MYTIHDRINSRKRYEWNAQISTNDTHTHNVSFVDVDGEVRGRIKKVWYNSEGECVKGSTIAENTWGKGDHPSDDETREWIFNTLKGL